MIELPGRYLVELTIPPSGMSTPAPESCVVGIERSGVVSS